jgi:hypothetical protein
MSWICLPSLIVVAAVAPSVAGAATAEFEHGRIEQTLTTTRPGTPVGMHFVGTYHAAGDPDSPPPYMLKMTAYDRSTMRRDTTVPELCTASDLELALSGAAACPGGSRLGGGSSDILFMDTFPSRVEIDVLNNTAEQIMVARSPGLATISRGRIGPDGSIEFASPTCYPSYAGCPVDNVLQLGSDITIPPYTKTEGGAVRSYMTTPSKCPKSGHWESHIRLWWKDGSADTAELRHPCTRPKAKPKRKRTKSRRGASRGRAARRG